ncbi:hypothetical protein [Gilvimarinus polysaccharolyticus]|uniref:hypothetical protein n=1 Tax=Gilvimarinus polysaccharolyticus TaxID=863921 RepID=UPI00067343C5|nr:hypothetical protein [Gilvimarinus polysaccharolyticus]
MAVDSTIIKPELNQPLKSMDTQSFLTSLILAIALYALYRAMADAICLLALWKLSSGPNVASDEVI